MGNRGYITVEQYGNADPVMLYTHNRAHELPTVLAKALEHGERWGEHDALAHVIYSQLTDGVVSPYGYGIGTVVYDDAWRVITVDPDPNEQTVVFESDHGARNDDRSGEEYGFEEFVHSELDDASINS